MSKRTWHHPEIPADDTTVAWKSVGQIEDSPEFREWLQREFPRGAAEMADEEDAETSRRSFMKLMGASTALAGFGMAACRRPESYILPYANAPEWVIPGKATYYASSMPRAGGATPLVVTSFEGRPTKLAPNTGHPDSAGTDNFAQASVLDLYSPTRSRQVLNHGRPASRDDLAELVADLAADPSARIGFVFGRDDSPTRSRVAKELQGKFAGARFYAYEALESEAVKALGGRAFVADFAKADRIVSLDCDFAQLDPVGPVSAFFRRRKPEGNDYDGKPSADNLNRLYVLESGYSLTGGMADHRLRLKPSEVVKAAAHIARKLGAGSAASGIDALPAEFQQWIDTMVDDLAGANPGTTLVVAGSRQPAAVHHLVAAINAKLGNIGEGRTLRCVHTDGAGFGDLAQLVADLQAGSIDTLVLATPSNPVYDAPADLKFGDALAMAQTSIHLGLRADATAHACTWHLPACHYLESWGDARSANGVHTVVQPMIYPLYPDSASELDLLLALLSDDGKLIVGEGEEGAPTPAYQAVRSTFEGLAGKGEKAWKDFLREGFLADSSYDGADFAPDESAAARAVGELQPASGIELIFATDGSIYDGRWIDNGWLQESPDPVSKVTWDNVALVSPKTAKKLNIYDQIVALETPTAAVPPDGEGEHRKGPVVKITANGVEMEIAAQIGFGQAEDTVIVPLGYGQGYNAENAMGFAPANQSHVGQVGINTGSNAYPLRTSATAYSAVGAAIATTDRSYPLAATQEHHSMYGRALAREVSTLEDRKTHRDFEAQLATVKKHGMDSHIPPNISLYKREDRQGNDLISDKIHQWAMSIDLSSCMGCNACLVACQAENNIPIVGKEQLAMGREMHWIRMDRYYAALETKDEEGNKVVDEDNPAMIPQPVACVQCENAPCETVCPVNATVHTEDGLNAMAYNRCIGTRYCANNCPYKARRFNFFDYNKRNPLVPHNLYRGPLGEKQVGTSAHLQRNPNVSVRMRGVMEKCTYCVQRLKDAKIRQKRGQKQEALAAGDSTAVEVSTSTLRIPVDSVKVACQEACPAEAISFGNLHDEGKARVNRAKAADRNYDLLNYIGTVPRTSYLARVKNPNPAMPGAEKIGRATIHMH